MKTETTTAVSVYEKQTAFSGPDSFVAAQRMAKALCSSTLVPEIYRGEQGVGNALIALEMSQRIGASPLAVMQNLHIIHGRPSLSSSFLIATVNGSGKFTPIRFRWNSEQGKPDWGCRAVANDKGTGEECVGALITLAMAAAEGWTSKNGSKWKSMPEHMMMLRAASFWVRTYAPELSHGMHTREEVEDAGVATDKPMKPAFASVVTETAAPAAATSIRHGQYETTFVPATATLVLADAVPLVVDPVPEPVPAPEPTIVDPVVPAPAPEPTPAATPVTVTAPEPVAAAPVTAAPVTAGDLLIQVRKFCKESGLSLGQVNRIAIELGIWETPYAKSSDMPVEHLSMVLRHKDEFVSMAKEVE